MKNAMRLTAGLFIAILASACNYTDGACYARGQGGAQQVDTGGVVIPTGVGGFGDAPPDPGAEPQGADGADPCNAVEGKFLYCNGDTVCYDDTGPGAHGCHYVNVKRTEASTGAAIEKLVSECAAKYPDHSCGPLNITCDSKPAAKTTAASTYSCNGGVTCTDTKGQTDGCSYSNEEVWAEDEEDARWFLAENCEVIVRDKYKGDDCDHGGFCCTPGSLTCNQTGTGGPGK